MLNPTRLLLVALIAFTGLAGLGLRGLGYQTGQQPGPSSKEEAYRANNIGVALLEQFKHKEAADQFRRALQIDPALTIARVNLCIALFNEPNINAALVEAKAAAAASPNLPQPHYILGLIARSQNRIEDAMAAFRRVLQIDARDLGASVNIGQILNLQRKYSEAIPILRAAFEAEPYSATAAYTLGIALNRGGQREEARRVNAQFDALRRGGYGTTLGQNYPEQGQYAEAIVSTGAEADLVDPATPDIGFTDVTTSVISAESGTSPREGGPLRAVFNRRFTAGEFNDATKKEIIDSLSSCAVLFDYDGDGDLDLFEAGSNGQHLYRNDGGKLTNVTSQSGSLSRGGAATGVIAGDYDNDARPDLFVLRHGANTLYHNDGNGRFSDVTSAAGLPAYQHLSISAAFVDVDHDGDLDIFIAGLVDLTKPPPGASTFPTDFAAAPNLLLRNNGDGKFTDITDSAKVAAPFGHAVAVVPTDYDNRRDVDLLVVNFNRAPTLFRNMRDGSFVDMASEAGLTTRGPYTSVAAGDVNKDGYTDFYFGAAGEPGALAISEGRGKFNVQPGPKSSTTSQSQTQQSAAQFVDYDNDGLLDLLRLSQGTAGDFALWRNIGGKWTEVTERATPRPAAGSTQITLAPRLLASGDLDGDGDTDLVVRAASGEIRVLSNEGGSRNRSFKVILAGKVSNRSGVGAKIEARAGSLRQRLETYSASPAPAPADVLFGLGKRSGIDALRVLWPAGIVQAESEMTQGVKTGSNQLAQSFTVTELDRKPSSCPYLYAWNGRQFEFVTDFMGGGEMGYWVSPGVWNQPDPDEYVRIREDQLKPRDGRYELRVTNELEEALFLDRFQLIAVAHPSDSEVFPNEGMVGTQPRQFKLLGARDARPPTLVIDDDGHDVTDRIAHLDRRYPDDFKLRRIRGYAEEHSLTIDLGPKVAERPLLLMTGWTDYAFSSDNVAAHQAGLKMMPPSLQVKDSAGRWRTVITEIGIPVGRPQTIPVDLTGKFLSDNREIRIVTNMRIYWDQILIASSEPKLPTRLTRLDPGNADLEWRGFSAEVTPDGREPFAYDYKRVSFTSPWKVLSGNYTREGDVRELVMKTDDMFVICRPGDQVALSFDTAQLPPLPRGWKHTFLFFADGFSKEMDINSATPDQVGPLPFHGMKSYPYGPEETYPKTRAHRRYLEHYNTRVVRGQVPRIEAIFAELPPGSQGRR